ncbi:MAG: hypothetical protein FJ224_10115 [Lentisphaerae bacterium]|nr:hypothetical protein [Lentisphaerota bacterium]
MTGSTGNNGGLSRRRFMGMAGAGLAASGMSFPYIGRPKAAGKSVVILGIDGLDPLLLRRFIAEGRMPHAQRLAAEGCLARCGTSSPPQSPVAWSDFIAGTDPGGHGIFDFIHRDPATLLPYLSTSRVKPASRNLPLGRLRIPLAPSRVSNLRRGDAFWPILERHGVECTVLRMPANFPPTPGDSRTLSGLGTPDIHGSYGVFTLYTDRGGEQSRNVPGGRIERVAVTDNAAHCSLIGPANSLDAGAAPMLVPFDVLVDPDRPIALVRLQNAQFILKEREWSDWIRVRFAMLPHLAETRGICRFFLRKARRDFELYVSPVNMDPTDPALPISTPPGYARELAGRIGLFYTQGMPPDISALSAGALSDDEYREQATYVLGEELRTFEAEFGRFRHGLFFCYFGSLDLNSHAFWRTMDRQHPLHSDELDRRHGDFIPWLYERMDGVIGAAAARIGRRDTLIVVSDHGFAAFRRQLNLNSWLADNGYTALSGAAERGSVGYFNDVNWGRTRAYALGINGLYINLRGREPDGTVGPGAEKEALERELAARLTALRDPVNGMAPVSNVYRASEIYHGPYADAAPDLIVGYGDGYRASWDTALGRYPRDVLLDNRDPWSGDHATDAARMAGVLMSNRRLRTESPRLSDMAPTVLREFGVDAPKSMTGRPVLQG